VLNAAVEDLFLHERRDLGPRPSACIVSNGYELFHQLRELTLKFVVHAAYCV